MRRRVVFLDVVVDVLAERVLGIGQLDAVLRTLGSGDRRDDGGQVQLEVLRESRLVIGVVPHALLTCVGLDERQLCLVATGQTQVVDGLVVDREDRCGRTEFRAHVAQRGAVGQRYLGHTLAVELDELAHHAVLAQHVGDGQHHVGGGHTRLDLAGELEADDARDEHGDRLAQHGCLGLDTPDSPAEHAQAVDHGGVRVRAHTGVGVGLAVAHHHGAGQVLDVDLVHDAGARRDDLEVVESALAPTQELIALGVALVFEFDVALEGVGRAEDVQDHRVVDDHLGGGQRVHLVRIATEGGDRFTHGGQVDHAGHTGEVLHDHAGRGELDFHARLGRGIPVGQRQDMVLGDVRAVFGA
ncbi:Uncharacterised protein [Mycobacteroides abscessus subsp. abscessus]|nr:Uncharacterised protein [Mycobacteroides abscessus subsp. abscessus]